MRLSHLRPATNKRTWAALVCIFVLAVVLISLSSESSVNRVKTYFRLATTHQAEKLTELYFTNPQELPETYKTETPVHVNFSIHNLEYRPMSYRYQVYVTGLSSPSPITSEIFIKDGGTQQISTELPAANYGSRAMVTVKLIDQGQAIHFWVTHE